VHQSHEHIIEQRDLGVGKLARPEHEIVCDALDRGLTLAGIARLQRGLEVVEMAVQIVHGVAQSLAVPAARASAQAVRHRAPYGRGMKKGLRRSAPERFKFAPNAEPTP